MRFFTASHRNEEILAEVISLEPDFASQTAMLRELLEAAAAGGSPQLPETLTELRRETTRRRWRNATADQNKRALRQVAIMRRASARKSLVRMLQQILADDFSGASFAGGFDASGMTFAADLVFSRCSIEGALRLDDARLLASSDFSGAVVGQDLTAERTQFAGPATFSGLDVGRAARLGFSEFLDDLSFDGATITRELWLRNSKVAGTLSAQNATLKRDAGLGNCVYGGPVDSGRKPLPRHGQFRRGDVRANAESRSMHVRRQSEARGREARGRNFGPRNAFRGRGDSPHP